VSWKRYQEAFIGLTGYTRPRVFPARHAGPSYHFDAFVAKHSPKQSST
jgi:hypothetical protein